MKISTILALALALFTFSPRALAKTTVPLTLSGNKSHIAVRIGDVTIPGILLDTGFAFDGVLIYQPHYRDSLSLPGAIEVSIGGAGSGEASKALMVDSTSFRIGDLELTNQKVIVLQGDAFKEFPSNGIIGYSIFGHYPIQIDYDSGTMTLHDPGEAKIDTSWTPIPLYFKQNNIPWMNVSVAIRNEQPTVLSAYIDFAAGDAVLVLEKTGMKVGLPERTTDVLLGTGLSGDVHGKTGSISKLIVGPYELHDVKASFARAEVRSRQKDADAVVGSGALRKFNLIFDYSNKTLYLKPNAHFDGATRPETAAR